MWICSRCGGDRILEERSAMVVMNDPDSETQSFIVGGLQNTGFYWCVECDDECNPIERDTDKVKD